MFSFRILDQDRESITDPEANGALVYGLFLEGAKWDKKKRSLSEQSIGQLYCEMPVIHFNPVLNTDKAAMQKVVTYKAPCYKTSKR